MVSDVYSAVMEIIANIDFHGLILPLLVYALLLAVLGIFVVDPTLFFAENNTGQIL